MPGRGLVFVDDESQPYAGFKWKVDPDFDPYAYRTDPSAPPILADFYNKWNQSHLDWAGVPYNRPWAKEGDFALRDQFVDQYTNAVDEYNQLYGTNYTPNQQSITAFSSSAPTAYAAADWTSQKQGNFFSGLVDFLGPILPIGLAVFGMPWLSPILGTVGAGAVLGATGSALTGGDSSDILKSAALGGLGGAASGIGKSVGEALTGATVSSNVASAIGNATTAGAKTLIQGGDLSDVLSSAVMSGASSAAGGYAGDFVGSAVGDSLGSPVATNVLTNAAKAAVSAAVRGGDVGQAALAGGLGAGWNALKGANLGAGPAADATITPVSDEVSDEDQFFVDPLIGEEPAPEPDWVSGEELPTGDYNVPTDWVSGEELPTGNYNLPEGGISTPRPPLRPPARPPSRPATTPPAGQPATVPQTPSQQGPSFDMLMQLASGAPSAAPQVNVQAPPLAMIPGWNPVSTPYGGPSLFASGGSVPDMYAVNQELLRMLRG
jgi:hypothetical protein